MKTNCKLVLRIIGAFAITAAATVAGQPVITNQPQSLTNIAGTTATFSLGVDGASPLEFQWWHSANGLTYPLASYTNASVTLSNVQAFSAAGSYWAVVTNFQGAVTSALATLTILTPPRIGIPPSNQTASLFADAIFRATANGDAPLSYQWRFNDADLLGMTNTFLTITNVQRADGGDYIVVVTNLSGSVTSQVATLTIVPFNSIYCFGFSWTDTGNCVWDPTQYWHNHACNGPMWPEFVSTNLGLAYVQANNYAHCGATSSDILNQVINFPVSAKPKLSLYCFWRGGVDFSLNDLTNDVVMNRLLQGAVAINSNSVNRLYIKGARAILFQKGFSGLFDVSKLTTNGNLLAKGNEYTTRFQTELTDAMNRYSETRPDLRFLFFDRTANGKDVRAHPAQYGFTKTDIDALDDPELTDKSFTGPGADYVNWDCCHVTSKFHKLIAAWNLDVLTNTILEKLEVRIAGGSQTIQMNHLQIGRDYTLQKSTELNTWTDVQSFTPSTGTNQWSSSLGNDMPAYFRLKWQR